MIAMIIRVETAANGVIHGMVANNADAARYLIALARDGIKCLRWEIVKGHEDHFYSTGPSRW